jgi:hypothetical protein
MGVNKMYCQIVHVSFRGDSGIPFQATPLLCGVGPIPVSPSPPLLPLFPALSLSLSLSLSREKKLPLAG